MPDRPWRDAIGAPGLAERVGLAIVDLRGDPGDGRFLDAARRSIGVPLPLSPCTSAAAGGVTALWLGPDEWLVTAEGHSPASLAGRLEAALDGLHGAVTDVSDARRVIRVSGPGAADLLAKGCSLDLHPRAFGPGACAQTLLARMAVVLHRPGEAGDLDVHVGRSYAEHLGAWLADACLEFLP